MPGLFIWEVQQRSDRTYRVADWGRNDPSRPLHATEAIRATDAGHQAARTVAIDWQLQGEQTLVTSPHFSARAVVGPWTGSIVVGPHGATATTGLKLQPCHASDFGDRIAYGNRQADLP